MDKQSLWKINATILELKEINDEYILPISLFYYLILIKRNDGFEWMVKKRYSDFVDLREKLIKLFPIVENILFPKKKFLKYFSWISNQKYNNYKNSAEDKKFKLQYFLDELLKIDKVLNSKTLINFFSR